MKVRRAGLLPIGRALCLAALAPWLAFAQSQLSAEARQLLSQPFVYKASEKKVSEVLQDFAASQSVPIVLAEGIEGSVSGSFQLGAQSFLKLVTDSYGLTWYYDGTALFVYPVKALQTKIFQMSAADANRVTQTLDALGLSDPRFPLRRGPEVGVLLVFGPPRYIELVSAIADSVAVHARDPSRQVVRMFPLRHAHASDRRQGEATHPGVAQLLSRIYGVDDARPALLGGARSRLWPSLTSPLSSLLPDEAGAARVMETSNAAMKTSQGALVGGPASSSAPSPTKSPAASPATRGDAAPLFEADEARNSVIVRARPEQFAEIEELIRQFDVPRDMVELEAVIIDVNHGDMRDLGLRWELGASGARISYGAPQTSVANGGNFSFTRLLGGASLSFMASIDALQAKGRARVVARPRVLGLANQPAVMKDSRTASVRVAGNLSASLYQVEAGTRIEMLARRVGPTHDKRLLLSLSIEDGKFDAQLVDTVPVVQRTEIHTEAYFDEGEALLIGGISSERSSFRHSRVPGLSDIPLIGEVFQSRQQTHDQMERLFLIVPRAVSGTRPLPPAAAEVMSGENAGEPARGTRALEEPAP